MEPHIRTGLEELTETRQRVLAMVAAGRTNAEIATVLGISLDGAKWHVREIM
jgi:DNA-binding NarL/FixJ family response regulator